MKWMAWIVLVGVLAGCASHAGPLTSQGGPWKQESATLGGDDSSACTASAWVKVLSVALGIATIAAGVASADGSRPIEWGGWSAINNGLAPDGQCR